MDLMEATVMESPVDLVGGYTGLEELPARHDTVLATGEGHDDPFGGSSE
jgi:hypothetical protein